ncbi:zinc-ribbon and DUF3426 domain-containing protein [Ideonella paludis]|uniref:Zinc-ribbon and DUF3426 domain-containing protein n=2 Tax=Ideonella paludis TaxID=1233411 RepID=A0ABS5DWI4_9BURK|nr:zinc-ribbon and DUF3426 domain-containing protein [Ideonella paludis]MBQ0935513.1 zinc-ribbon and DUF3426 domain-containing protein [Ideonella paludis]
MSLATRCPACSTTFKVVQDQLKISEGWVRCGHCQEVFNALHSLFDLHPPVPEQPPETPLRQRPSPFTDVDLAEPSIAVSAPAMAEPAPQDVALTTGAPPQTEVTWDFESARPIPTDEPLPVPEVTVEDEADTLTPPLQFAGIPQEAPAPPALAVASEEPPHARAPAPAEPPQASSYVDTAPSVFAEQDANAPQAEEAAEALPKRRRSKRRERSRADGAEPRNSTLKDPSDPRSRRRKRRRKPEFMRSVERAAHWERPGVRAVLGAASAALSLLLLLQVMLHWRDDLSAKWPITAPVLQASCQVLGCKVSPPRALERIVLDQSQLTRTAYPETLRFTADLHNTANHAVRLPALELLFSDSNGQTLVRKVILPEDLKPVPAAIDADGVWHVDTLLKVGSLKVASFSTELFYP